MPRYYSVAFTGVASTVQAQFFELTPAANKPITLLSCTITQDSDAQDANEKLLRFELFRGSTSTGAGGTATTPQPLGTSTAAAAGFTAQTMSTGAVGSTASAVLLHAEAFNARAGLFYKPLLEERVECSTANSRLTLRLAAAPADSVTFTGTCYVLEV